MVAVMGSNRPSVGDYWALFFVAVAFTGVGIWYVVAGNEIEARREVAERSFTPAEMAEHSNEVIATMTRVSQDYARSLRNLPWPPAPADVKLVDDNFRARLDAINHTLTQFEVPQTTQASQLYFGLRSLVHCLRKTTIAVHAIDTALKAGAAKPDFQTWFARFDAHCAAARTRLQTAWTAFAAD